MCLHEQAPVPGLAGGSSTCQVELREGPGQRGYAADGILRQVLRPTGAVRTLLLEILDQQLLAVLQKGTLCATLTSTSNRGSDCRPSATLS